MTSRRASLLLVAGAVLASSACRHTPARSGPTIVAGRVHDLVLDFDRAEPRVEGRAPRENEPVHIKVAKMTCGGVARTALQVHPPASVTFDLRLDPSARLRTAVGIDDRVATHSDGVRFVVELQVDGRPVPVWARHLVPGDPDAAGWRPVEVDLSPWSGRTVKLVLRTEAAGTSSADWAGFASPQILSQGHRRPAPDFSPGAALLVSLDTLRLDEVGGCGSPFPTTPQLDALLRRSHHYYQALSPSHWTMPAHMSALTSTYPDVHGVEPEGTLSRSLPTLAEVLHERGFHTAAFVEDVPWLRPDYGFGRGFDLYLPTREPAATRVHRVREFLERAHAPLFLFVHFYDAHSDLRRAAYDASAASYTFAAPELSSFPPCHGEGCLRAFLKRMNDRGERFAPAAERAMRQMYRAGLLDLDLALGQLRRELREVGILDAGPLVMMSDHGEEFGDHGRYLHTQLYAETTRVLLAVHSPRDPAGDLRAGLASLVDVSPTILAAVGERAPAVWEGSDLTPGIRSEAYTVGQRGEVALRTEQETLIRHPDGTSERYDRLRDPGETAPAPEPGALDARLSALADRHAALRATFGAGAGAPLTDEELEDLKALGYTIGVSASAGEPRSDASVSALPRPASTTTAP